MGLAGSHCYHNGRVYRATVTVVSYLHYIERRRSYVEYLFNMTKFAHKSVFVRHRFIIFAVFT